MNEIVPQKTCTKCGQTFHATHEYFYKAPNGKYGLQATCKDCHNKLSGVGLNPKNSVRDGFKVCSRCKRKLPATLEFYYQSKDTAGGVSSQCRDCSKEVRGIWKREHREQLRIEGREYYQSHKEEYAARQRKYLVDSPERFRAATIRRRAKKKSLPGDFTGDNWKHCLEYWNGRCCICGRMPDFWHCIAREHWIALSDTRADNPGTVPWNILPMCHSTKGTPAGDPGCNNIKHYDDPIEFLNRYFGKRKAKQKLAEIEAYFEWVKTK